VRKISVDQT